MQKLFYLAIISLSAGCSCSTLFGTKASQSAKSHADVESLSKEARVQETWQTRFKFAVKEAGYGAEGWALFADSPMGHSGQQLVVRFPEGDTKFCYASQAVDDCTYETLSTDKWQVLEAATAVADGLSDRPLQTFDTLNLEYVHVKNIDGVVTNVARVFFMVDPKPLPADYDKLMDAFTGLNKP